MLLRILAATLLALSTGCAMTVELLTTRTPDTETVGALKNENESLRRAWQRQQACLKAGDMNCDGQLAPDDVDTMIALTNGIVSRAKAPEQGEKPAAPPGSQQ